MAIDFTEKNETSVIVNIGLEKNKMASVRKLSLSFILMTLNFWTIGAMHVKFGAAIDREYTTNTLTL